MSIFYCVVVALMLQQLISTDVTRSPGPLNSRTSRSFISFSNTTDLAQNARPRWLHTANLGTESSGLSAKHGHSGLIWLHRHQPQRP